MATTKDGDTVEKAARPVEEEIVLGPREAEVLGALAQLPLPASAKAVCDAVGGDGYFIYQSTLNCLNRLVAKGLLERKKVSGAYVFHPVVDVEELAAKLAAGAVAPLGAKLDRVLCRLLEIDPDLGEQELAGLRERVRRMRRRK